MHYIQQLSDLKPHQAGICVPSYSGKLSDSVHIHITRDASKPIEIAMPMGSPPIVDICGKFCFTNRKRIDGKRREIFMSVKEMSEKFMSMSGLGRPSTWNGRNLHLGKTPFSAAPKDHIKSGFYLLNLLQVNGSFIIQDMERFENALADGVGNYFIYGYGLIIIKKG